MINVVADLHLHSKYSRAVSPQMVPETMAKYAKQKGLDLLATGDFTHPMWYRELRNTLEETEEGIFQLKFQISNFKSQINTNNQNDGSWTSQDDEKKTKFLLSVEIACIYTQKGKGRRIHNLVFAPDFTAVEKINKELIKRGYNISSDGRPIIGLSSKNLLQLILEIDEKCMLIPAHIWTPWFGVLGMASGFDSLEECFEELSPYVYGIETGLSSDPEMNWQLKELDTRSILSFSDAHSPMKMGREATVFELESLTYGNIREAIMTPSLRSVILNNSEGTRRDFSNPLKVPQIEKKKNVILYTIEFYPEEGKYHYSGHRACGVTMTPQQQRENDGICPVCRRPVTDGVMRRVQELSVQNINSAGSIKTKANGKGVKWYADPKKIHPPFVKLVPLNEIIAEAIGSPAASPKVKAIFDKLCNETGNEMEVLLISDIEEIKSKLQAGSLMDLSKATRIEEAIQKVREGNIVVIPGYDGVYGVVHIWDETSKLKEIKKKSQQIGLF